MAAGVVGSKFSNDTSTVIDELSAKGASQDKIEADIDIGKGENVALEEKAADVSFSLMSETPAVSSTVTKTLMLEYQIISLWENYASDCGEFLDAYDASEANRLPDGEGCGDTWIAVAQHSLSVVLSKLTTFAPIQISVSTTA